MDVSPLIIVIIRMELDDDAVNMFGLHLEAIESIKAALDHAADYIETLNKIVVSPSKHGFPPPGRHYPTRITNIECTVAAATTHQASLSGAIILLPIGIGNYMLHHHREPRRARRQNRSMAINYTPLNILLHTEPLLLPLFVCCMPEPRIGWRLPTMWNPKANIDVRCTEGYFFDGLWAIINSV